MRIGSHFQMFKAFLTVEPMFVIAHRNRLIYLLLTNEPKEVCVDQIEFPDNVSFLFKKKRTSFDHREQLIVCEKCGWQMAHQLFVQLTRTYH